MTTTENENLRDAAWQDPVSRLAGALVRAQQRAEAVEKDATNAFHRYKYASAEAIIAEARAALAAEGLAVFTASVDADPAQRDHVWQGEGNAAWIITPRRIRVVYLLLHESGESMEFVSSTPVIPEKGRPEDKAEFGARTENLGYALRDLLLLPRVADGIPSARDDRASEPKGPAPAPKAPAAAKSAAVPTNGESAPLRSDRLRALLLGKAPAGLGWAKPHAVAWLKKYFGVTTPLQLNEKQLSDAELLLLSRMSSNDEHDPNEYRIRLEQFAAEGRVLTADAS